MTSGVKGSLCAAARDVQVRDALTNPAALKNRGSVRPQRMTSAVSAPERRTAPRQSRSGSLAEPEEELPGTGGGERRSPGEGGGWCPIKSPAKNLPNTQTPGGGRKELNTHRVSAACGRCPARQQLICSAGEQLQHVTARAPVCSAFRHPSAPRRPNPTPSPSSSTSTPFLNTTAPLPLLLLLSGIRPRARRRIKISPLGLVRRAFHPRMRRCARAV